MHQVRRKEAENLTSLQYLEGCGVRLSLMEAVDGLAKAVCYSCEKHGEVATIRDKEVD